jgi:serine/threonine protein kinase
MTSALRDLHTNNIIHRDVKPSNILTGADASESQFYLVDLGISGHYRKADSNEERPRKMVSKFFGSMPYASIDTHMGLEPGPKDDLEALMYTMVYLATGTLPWLSDSDLCEPTANETVLVAKMNIDPINLFQGLPTKLSTLYDYIRSLKFSETPDYGRVISDLHEAEM